MSCSQSTEDQRSLWEADASGGVAYSTDRQAAKLVIWYGKEDRKTGIAHINYLLIRHKQTILVPHGKGVSQAFWEECRVTGRAQHFGKYMLPLHYFCS